MGGFQHLSIGCRDRNRYTSLTTRWIRYQLLLWQASTPIPLLEKGSLRLILNLLLRGRNGMIHDLHLRVCLRHQILLVQKDLRGLRDHGHAVHLVPVLHWLRIEEHAAVLRAV